MTPVDNVGPLLHAGRQVLAKIVVNPFSRLKHSLIVCSMWKFQTPFS
jgi:hypothetical protein